MPISPVADDEAWSAGLGTLVDFPNEIFENIFVYLGINDWLFTRLVSKPLRELADMPEVTMLMIKTNGNMQAHFLLSVRNNNAPMVSRFLNEDIDVNTTDAKGNTALDYIVCCEQREIVSYLLEKKEQLNATGHNKVICLAAEYGFYDEVLWALEQPGVTVDATNKAGEAPFLLAGRGGHTEILKYLLGKGEASIPDSVRLAALLAAVENGHEEAVDFLLTLPGLTVCNENFAGETALHLAVRSGSDGVVRSLLLKHGEELRKTVYYGEAFRLAAHLGHDKIVSLLLQNPDLDVNETDAFDRSALDFAVAGNYVETLKVLMRKRGPTIEKRFIESAFRSATVRGFLECAALLTALSGDINAADEKGCTALHRACINRHPDVVKLLLQVDGVDVNVIDDERNSALFYVVENDDREVLSMLLKKGHDKEVLEKVLHFAVKRGLVGMARQLLREPTIDVNARDLIGSTYLSVAVMDNRLGMVRLLVESRGKEFNKEDVQAALAIAEKSSRISPEIAKLLKKLLDGETADETAAPAVTPPLAPRVSSGINMSGLLVKIALVAGLIITTALAAFAIQGMLLPYSIIATASSGAMTLILGIYSLYSLISGGDKRGT